MNLFPDLHPEFDIKEAQTVLGYPRHYVVDEPVRHLIELSRQEMEQIIKPAGKYVELQVELDEESVKLSSVPEISFQSSKLARHLRGSTGAYLFVVTIGLEAEEMVKTYFEKGELTRAMVLDAVASAFAEGTAEAAYRYLQEQAAGEGYELTSRYSPGYGDFSLENQAAFFQLLKPEEIGVYLTDGYMMIPRKSITAICGKKPLTNK